MTEPTVEPTPRDPVAAQATEPDSEPADTTDWKAEARKWEQRAKENRAAANHLEKQRQASMTDAEKAVAEAEQRGRTAALTSLGQRLVRSEFVAAAAQRNPGFDATAILDDLNLSRYLSDDGEPDTKAIAKAVERLVPSADPRPHVPDLGSRKPVPAAPDMNDLIFGGIRRR